MRNLSDDFESRFGQERAELCYLDRLHGALNQPLDAREALEHAAGLAVHLFWEVWEPQEAPPRWTTGGWSYSQSSDGTLEPQAVPSDRPKLPQDIEQEFIEQLDFLDECYRITYEPDVTAAKLQSDLRTRLELCLSVHLAAARGMAIRRSDGYSEAALGCVDYACRSAEATLLAPFATKPLPLDIAIRALHGALLTEQAGARFRHQEFQDGLSLLARGLERFEDADNDLDALTGKSLYQHGWSPRLGYELRTNVSPRDVIHAVLELLDGRGGSLDWAQIAKDLRTIGRFWEDEDEGFLINVEYAVDTGSGTVGAYTLVSKLQGRVEQLLTRNELREYFEESLRQKEDEQAEHRLRRYFFTPEAWSALPEKTRRSLVEADRKWVDTRAGRLEGVLNDLRVAVESLIYEMFWLSFRDSGGLMQPGILRSEKTRKDLVSGRSEPSLKNYAELFKNPAFGPSPSSLTDSQRQFLRQRLPKELRKLAELRRNAEHLLGPGDSLPRADVETAFRQFLGINCEGIISSLIRINERMQNNRRDLS